MLPTCNIFLFWKYLESGANFILFVCYAFQFVLRLGLDYVLLNYGEEQEGLG